MAESVNCLPHKCEGMQEVVSVMTVFLPGDWVGESLKLFRQLAYEPERLVEVLAFHRVSPDSADF